MSFHELTLTQARDSIADRRLGSEEYVRALLDRLSALDGGDRGLGCFLDVFAERALARAREVDTRQGLGHYAGLLAGVPVAIKDNICTAYGRTTCASRLLENYESPYSATAVERLEKAGAVVLGKTNLDEFAMGSSTEHSALRVTRNPWDTQRVPGGSSGGSAAAVAARLVPGALGSDTGGSVRQPAALCGIVGLKPTYGLVSRWGLVAYASSLDQIGTLARNVPDAALLLQVIAGHDALDSTSARRDVPDLLGAIEEPIEGLRLGVPRECLEGPNDPRVAALFAKAIEVYRGLGATIVDIELPHLAHGIAAYYIIAPAEASSNLARFDGVRYGRRAAPSAGSGDALRELYARSRAEGFGKEVQRRILLGTYVLSSGYYDAYYLTALKARWLIKQDFDNAFAAPGASGSGGASAGAGVHAVLMPSVANPAFKIGQMSNDPLAMYLEDLYTVTANLAGIPAISVPAGFVSEGGHALPVGLQLLAPAYEETRLLRIARMYELQTKFAEVAPAL